MTDHVEILAETVVLRPTSDNDLPALRRLFGDPGFFEYWDGYAKSDEELIEKYAGRRRPDVECFLVLVDDHVVGFVQYYVIEPGRSGGMDMVLLPDRRGHGIGTRVVQAIVHHVHDTLGWSRLVVDPQVSNERGVNFWRKVGFVPEGIVSADDGQEQHWRMAWPFDET